MVTRFYACVVWSQAVQSKLCRRTKFLDLSEEMCLNGLWFDTPFGVSLRRAPTFEQVRSHPMSIAATEDVIIKETATFAFNCGNISFFTRGLKGWLLSRHQKLIRFWLFRWRNQILYFASWVVELSTIRTRGGERLPGTRHHIDTLIINSSVETGSVVEESAVVLGFGWKCTL